MNKTRIHESERVLIVGLGLLGTSLALALRDDSAFKVMGWTRRKTVRDDLLAKGVISETNDELKPLLAAADVTILCLPIPEIINVCVKFAECFQPGSVVTDVGSVKRVVVDAAESAFSDKDVSFLGGHPMAGTEKTGPDAALPELFEKSVVFLTPPERIDLTATNIVEKIWRSAGATEIIRISPETHDQLVAETSHVTHLIAWTLVEKGLNGESSESRRLKRRACSSAFRDVTRVASSSPEMWRQIVENNRDEVANALDGFTNELHKLKQILRNESFDDLQDWLQSGKSLRDSWFSKRWKP